MGGRFGNPWGGRISLVSISTSSTPAQLFPVEAYKAQLKHRVLKVFGCPIAESKLPRSALHSKPLL